METQLKIPKFNMIKSNPKDYYLCFKIFEENMKEIIENNEEWNENKFEESFNTREIRIIYDKKSKTNIGFFQIKYKKGLTFIKKIQIQKEFQNKGFESEILKIILKEAKEKNLPKLQLKKFQNNPSIKLYEDFGFRITKKLNSSYIMEL
ncbi:MAG: GNAT family N-acetyltransferase [Nanoarchaeales archaeon]|nr:GNAT family N-acetyltransferase [Nanoarchaeales archaeon]